MLIYRADCATNHGGGRERPIRKPKFPYRIWIRHVGSPNGEIYVRQDEKQAEITIRVARNFGFAVMHKSQTSRSSKPRWMLPLAGPTLSASATTAILRTFSSFFSGSLFGHGHSCRFVNPQVPVRLRWKVLGRRGFFELDGKKRSGWSRNPPTFQHRQQLLSVGLPHRIRRATENDPDLVWTLAKSRAVRRQAFRPIEDVRLDNLDSIRDS